jgi:hypothetical protein
VRHRRKRPLARLVSMVTLTHGLRMLGEAESPEAPCLLKC